MILPMELVYYMVQLSPMEFIVVSKHCNKLCKSTTINLPYNYRTQMTGFKCRGTGCGMVLRECELEGYFEKCHFTRCTLTNMRLTRGVYHDCTFTNCFSHGMGIKVNGGSMLRCRFYYNHTAVENSGDLLLDNCEFQGNGLSVLGNGGSNTTILNCTSVADERFALCLGPFTMRDNRINGPRD